ncbi:hypothetical protein HPB48_018524 [Haemaphysalis longicornis]|uniref:Uncharacterized protein n=1 Tax=Haemaphysalis longicornis TaxID=44386 RepID=A0A9J6GYD5_HAELO|nr:hypothetical protein HPB48_018524 [Haemaphysalis longicornis]
MKRRKRKNKGKEDNQESREMTMPTDIDYEDGDSEPTPSCFDSPSKNNEGASDGEDEGQKTNCSKYKTTTKMNELSHCATATAQGKQNQDGGQNTAEDYPPLDSSEEGEEASTLRERLQEVERRVIKQFIDVGVQCNKNTRMALLTDSLLEDFLSMRKKVPTVKYFETAKTTEEQPTGALILTAANLKPAALQNLIKRNVDPCQLGLRNVKLRQSKEGVIVSSTSAEGLKRLEEHITKDNNLRDVAARKPRVQLPEFKIVGIEDNIEDEEIVERIVGQNNINAGKEDIELIKTWKGKSRKTAVIKTGKKHTSK